MPGPSLGPAMDSVLRALPQVECTAIDPKRCYCARGTTKPIAEISPSGAVLQMFCSGPEAKRVLGVSSTLLYTSVDKPRALESGHFLRYIPDGKCANAGAFKVHGERKTQPKVHEASSLDHSVKRSRVPTTFIADEQGQRFKSHKPRVAADYDSNHNDTSLGSASIHSSLKEERPTKGKKRGRGGSASKGPSEKEERPVNPNCTSKNPRKCYCRTGRARAVVRVDAEGNVIKEYCGAAGAAARLGVANCSVSHCCAGHAASVQGMFFRYKEDGEGHKHGAHVVLQVDGETGEVIQEFPTARDAGRALNVSNSLIGKVCHGKLAHVDGYYFRFKDASVAQFHALKLGTIGQANDDDGAPPTEAEAEVAKRLNLMPGVSEVLFNFGSHWEVGVFVRAIIHDAALVTPQAGSHAAPMKPSSAVMGTDETLEASFETAEAVASALVVTASKTDFRFSFKNGSFKRNLTEAEVKASLIVPPPLPPPLPAWPHTHADSAARYWFDEVNRVVRVDVSGLACVPPSDAAYIAVLMDRPDVTLVIKGLAEDLSPHLWSEPYLRARCGNLMLHKIRSFKRRPEKPPISVGDAEPALSAAESGKDRVQEDSNSSIQSSECVESEWRSMSMDTFFDYLHARDDAHRAHRATRREKFTDESPDLKVHDEVCSQALKSCALGKSPPEQDALIVGTMVEARFRGGKSWFRGVVHAVHSDNSTPGQDLNAAEDASHESAKKKLKHTDYAENAATSPSSSAKSYDVSYDDGDFETHVPSDLIRLETSRPVQDSAESGGAQQEVAFATVDEGPMFGATNHEGKVAQIPLLREGLYLIDFDIPRHLPELARDLLQHFKLDLLPRGDQCLLRFLPSRGHPFMGPNLYVTPPGTFTHFHQDGHGTVDSGHQCLRGSNEVVMLRRLDEPNKRRALRVLCGAAPGYDALYGKPHDSGAKPPWPTKSQIDELRALGYCPSVFTLGPGEYVHINKGRLHAFRKKSPPDDASPEQFCVSVAWDWLYQGSTSDAVEAELQEPLACASFNATAKVPSLSHTDAAVLHGSLAHKARLEATAELKAAVLATAAASAVVAAAPGCPCVDDNRRALLSGLKPALASVVDRQEREASAATFAQTHGKYDELGPGAAASWSSLQGVNGSVSGGLSGGASRRRGQKASPLKPAAAASTVAASDVVAADSTNTADTDATTSAVSANVASTPSLKSTSTIAAKATAVTTASAASAASEQATAKAQLPTRVLSLEPNGAFPVDVNVPPAARLVASAPPLPKDNSNESQLRSPQRALSDQSEPSESGQNDEHGNRVLAPRVSAPTPALPLPSAVEDPFSCDAYVCRSCARELAHAYLQCVGCRALLKQPLHLCVNCHAAGAHVATAPLGNSPNLTTTSAHFTPLAALSSHRPLPPVPPTAEPSPAASSSSSSSSSVLSSVRLPIPSPELGACRCRDELCPRCEECAGCRCSCHLDFELRYRFMPPGAMAELTRECLPEKGDQS